MRSIRHTIVVSITAALLFMSVTAVVAALVVIRQRLTDNFDAHLRLKAEAVASLLEMDDGELELDERDQALGEFQHRRQASYFEVRLANGTTLERSLSLKETLDTALPEETKFTTQAITLPDGRAGRIGLLPIVPGGPGEDDDPRPARDAGEDEPPVAWVLVAAGTEEVSAALSDIAWVLAGAGTLVSVVVIVATPRLVAHGLKPLSQLSDHASRLDADNLAERFPTDGLPAELSPITVQLNASLDRIREAFDRERRFAASAAHELRTPLSAIRANAEVALKWPDSGRTEAALGHIVSSARRMQSLMERLLEMARLGGEQSPGAAEPIDLRALVQNAIESIGPTLQARGLTVSADMPEAFVVRSDPNLLQPLVDNLIANAAQHADPDTPVRITADASRRCLLIANRTADFDAADMAHVFDPLWTRSADRSQGHAGLGLALVAEYARILGIRVEPSLSRDGWFTQQITFPS